ncbi:MAG TPA: glycosyltransferase, partial [Candidatus Nitrosotenuis sp.]|nr:glycosyltransferase [Candidatus Nitrosotenuis sp.]
LDDCLASLVAQTEPPDEVLVVDGGSRDGSRQIVERYAAGAPFQLRWLDQGPVPGLAQARNQGVRAARGEIVSFLDVDARAHPQWVARTRRRFAERPDVAGVGGQGREVGTTPADRFRAVHFQQGWGPRLREDVVYLWGLCSHYRREALQAVGLFDTRFRGSGEDVEMGLRLREAGYRLLYDPEILVDHARRDDWRSLGQMMDRWAYYGHIAQLRHGRGRHSPLFFWARFVYLCLRWLWRDAPRQAGRLAGWWRRPLYYFIETRAVLRAQRDQPG